MSNYLMINGKKIRLTEEQVKILTEEPKKDIWRKADYNEEYFHFNNDVGEVESSYETEHDFDKVRFKNGNYCLEKEPMEREKLNIILYQRLNRFTHQNGWDEKVWNDREKRKETIWYDTDNEIWKTDWTYVCDRPMQVYFVSERIAKQAIEEVVEPFMKEFPEYMKVD